MAKKDLTKVSAWNTPAPTTDAGPLADHAANLNKLVKAHKKLFDKLKFEDSTLPGLHIESWRSWSRSVNVDYSAELGVTPDSLNLLLPIVFDGTVHRYILYPNGDITDMDRIDWTFDAKERDGKVIRDALSRITSEIDDRVRKAQSRQAGRRRKQKIASVIAAIVLVLASVGGLIGYNVHQGNLAETAVRSAYDASNPQLPGQGSKVTYLRATTVSDAKFNEIPESSGDEDPLTSPRRVTMSKSNTGDDVVCIKLPQFRDGSSVRVALPESSPIDDARFVLGLSGSGVPELCAIRPEVIDKQTGSYTVAVQIVP